MSDVKNELLYKQYPVKDQDGNVVDYRTITKVLNLDNMAGFVIGLSDNEVSLLISYKEASDIVNKQKIEIKE